jgi:hypothetical protein
MVGAVVLSGVLALAIVAIASAASVTVRAGKLVFTLGGTATPKALPKHEYKPVAMNIFGKIKTSDGSHPSALREVFFDIDKDAKVNPKGYPACDASQLNARDTKGAKKACGNAIVGDGLAHGEIAFPEQAPLKVASPITVFNGGVRGGKTTLLIHTFITVPVPAAIVTQVTIEKKGVGLHSVAKIPVISGGSGSAVDFDFTLGKTFTYKGKKVGFFEGKCPDGTFKVSAPKILFKNEAGIADVPAKTVLSGSLQGPCTPKG